MSAYQAITSIFRQGIPAANLSPIANADLKGSMTFILYKINQVADLKEKERASLRSRKMCGGLCSCYAGPDFRNAYETSCYGIFRTNRVYDKSV